MHEGSRREEEEGQEQTTRVGQKGDREETGGEEEKGKMEIKGEMSQH